MEATLDRRAPARREFLRFLSASPLFAVGLGGCSGLSKGRKSAEEPGPIQNVFDWEQRAFGALDEDAYGYLVGGADDERTLRANTNAYHRLQARARRLVDVAEVDTAVEVLGSRLPSPLFTCPVGFQGIFHEQAELATARATGRRGHLSMISSCATEAIADVTAAAGGPVWFQLYPTPNPDVAAGLLRRAEDAGCEVVVLTVDTPIIGHRERHGDYLSKLLAAGVVRLRNYEGLRTDEPITDPTMDWSMIDWLREHCAMKVVLKGIVTGEDAALARERGVDAVLVSNHGGRQEESDRSTIECVEEVVAAAGDMLVLVDGGIRRGTDIFKALALGASAVGIGRPFLWGLAAAGEEGVASVLDLLDAELVRALQLFGVTAASEVSRSSVHWRGA